ncbi:MAG: hypothetical protein B7Y80_09595 [Hyphomicrobium sp. 32-62-53]|nr:MAG: hypothetical protein B7Z29_09120 [Hyphomicrobium sp. 12-62-95]OYX99831.1 MAG: hypothetical protein B7Y80_09595 [Hyphomicrobium sp. 32-62-53]
MDQYEDFCGHPIEDAEVTADAAAEDTGLPSGFRYAADGWIEYQATSSKGNAVWERLCSQISFVAFTRDHSSQSWGRLLVVVDRDGCEHRWVLPNRLLSGDGHEYRRPLLDMGLQLAPGRQIKGKLDELLNRASPSKSVICVDRLGWHGDSYVLADRTLTSGTEVLVYQGGISSSSHLRCSGTLEDWKTLVAEPCEESSRIVFALSVAFAGPLLYVSGHEGGGIHLRGASSTGKTTALLMAGSVWGGGSVNGNICTWRGTANGLEAVAAEHCDGFLGLDEISQISPDQAAETAYMLANGQGKVRASREGTVRTAASWRLVFLSTGEISLQDKMLEGRLRSVAGQEVRVLDLPADAGQGLGIFDAIPDGMTAGKFAEQLALSAKSHYGVAGVTFLENLVQRRDEANAMVTSIVDRFVQEHVSGTCGQVHRAARRFGLIAAAGELAISWEILPYVPGRAYAAASRCFEDWLETSDVERAIDALRKFIALHGDSRFQVFYEPPGRVVYNRAGFRDGDVFLIYPTIWNEEIFPGFDVRVVNAELVKRRVLTVDGAGKPQVGQRLPGSTKVTRMYEVHLNALMGSEDGPEDNGL